MRYRTKTYIAGDWTGDHDLIEKLYQWNENDNLNLEFTDAHEETQSKDTSRPCSIKKSLASRLDISKTFVLIVGKDTKSLRKGSCVYCGYYDSDSQECDANGAVSYRSFIEYECYKAVKDNIRIVVIYNYASVCKEKCPEIVRDIGKHIKGRYYKDDKEYWNYKEIKDAIMNN